MGFSFRPPERRIWTVRDLVAAVRTHLEREYSDAWVEGEISNFRAPDSGHLYFTLKDGSAQIRVVMFRSSAKLLRFRPADGMQVMVRGRVTVYEDRGELQISAEYHRAQGRGRSADCVRATEGEAASGRIVRGRAKEGDPGLAGADWDCDFSAGGGAARHSQYLAAAASLGECGDLSGAGAGRGGAGGSRGRGAAISTSERSVEVIIVARGGGSAEDLAAFNDEGLARAVAASEIPVISAVGHETDFTIVDFVADLRAPTPSAAAELVIRSRQESRGSGCGVARAAGARGALPAADGAAGADGTGAAWRVWRA